MISLHAVPEAVAPRDRSTWLARLYMAMWGLLAGCALVYLALLVARPDTASIVSAPSKPTQSAANQTDLVGVLNGLSALRSEIAALRDDVEDRNRRQKMFAERLSALEMSATKASDPVESTPLMPRASDMPATTSVSANLGPDKPAMLLGTTVQGRVEEKAVKSPSRPAVATSQPGPFTTATAPPRPAPTSAIRIATGPSVDAIRLSWQLLLEGQRSVLKPLEPRWIEVAGTPSSFALLAGPVGTPEDAAKICATLKTKGIPCAVTRFGGQPL